MKRCIRCCISCILPCGALDVIRIVHSNGRVEEITGNVRAAEIMKAYPKHVLKKPTSRPPDTITTDDDGYGGGVSFQVPRIVVVPPEAQLKRGKIYFLIPVVVGGGATYENNKNKSAYSSSELSKSNKKQSSSRKTISSREVDCGRSCRPSSREVDCGRSCRPSTPCTSTTSTSTTSTTCTSTNIDEYNNNYKGKIRGYSSRRRLGLQGARSSHLHNNNSIIDAQPQTMAGMSSDQYLREIMREKISTRRDTRRGRVAVWRPHLDSICESASDSAAGSDR